jgi:hypothetical protein
LAISAPSLKIVRIIITITIILLNTASTIARRIIKITNKKKLLK